MNHWLIAPVILPALMAPFIVTAARHDIVLQRVFSIASAVALLAIAIGLYGLAADGVPRPYALGNWPAPFGIILVLMMIFRPQGIFPARRRQRELGE